MTKPNAENLIYIDDYLDIVEALQLDLQKSFTLLKEMDGYSQDATKSTAKAAIDLIDNIEQFDAKDRFTHLKNLIKLLEESAQRGSEKAALAKVTSDAIDRHCNRLDADLVKYEELQPIGSTRITALPGMVPTSKHLRNYSQLSVKEKMSKRLSMFNNEKQQQQQQQQQQSTRKKRTGKAIKAIPSRRTNNKLKNSDSDMPVDPNEPLYCYCQQISYGEMVACDNTDCEIEWFHLACVNLKTVPKGKWYCANCSGYKGKQRR
ncbi:hypothetical protein BDF20DRAFT_444540 [Mycotypha africana]|uniref:uncharacterized protein n=1 Tax=Mycotypha africana TaxID=64632 RepID=UPI0023004418|nr:uncharacterized protein BDF20DRAFT_444540 [Mycotypha africana]KAI8981986.1 hypothetical protein BDF20DRAFT_444540 [Mycotypha africana]